MAILSILTCFWKILADFGSHFDWNFREILARFWSCFGSILIEVFTRFFRKIMARLWSYFDWIFGRCWPILFAFWLDISRDFGQILVVFWWYFNGFSVFFSRTLIVSFMYILVFSRSHFGDIWSIFSTHFGNTLNNSFLSYLGPL